MKSKKENEKTSLLYNGAINSNTRNSDPSLEVNKTKKRLVHKASITAAIYFVFSLPWLAFGSFLLHQYRRHFDLRDATLYCGVLFGVVGLCKITMAFVSLFLLIGEKRRAHRVEQSKLVAAWFMNDVTQWREFVDFEWSLRGRHIASVKRTIIVLLIATPIILGFIAFYLLIKGLLISMAIWLGEEFNMSPVLAVSIFLLVAYLLGAGSGIAAKVAGILRTCREAKQEVFPVLFFSEGIFFGDSVVSLASNQTMNSGWTRSSAFSKLLSVTVKKLKNGKLLQLELLKQGNKATKIIFATPIPSDQDEAGILQMLRSKITNV